MEENLIRIPNQVIEELRCSQCKGYLSCGPVRLIPDGIWICGQCSPPNSDTVVYRGLILEETILKYVAFPCRFKTNGCRIKVTFGQAMEHESKCVYQSYHCILPVRNGGKCCWSGLRSEFFNHLTKNHSSSSLEAAHFIIQVDQNCEGIFTVLKGDFVLLVTYLYLTSTRSLNYDVAYFNIDRTVFASYQINLQNNEIPDCNLSLERNECPIFGNRFNKLNNTLHLNKYIEALDNPNSIKFDIILKSLNKLTLDTVKGILTVDQAKLSLLRCRNKRCMEYLAFPIFDVNNITVCFKCASNNCNPKECADMQLQQHIMETNFPCRWQSCKFIGTGDIIHTHEIHCQFRDYSCPICFGLIKTNCAAQHLLLSHGTQCVSGKEPITVTLEGNMGSVKYVFLIEHNKVIIFKFSYGPGCGGCFEGELLLSIFEDEKVTVQFNYKQCRRGPIEFALSKALPKIDYSESMPSCHRSAKELTVTLRNYEF